MLSLVLTCRHSDIQLNIYKYVSIQHDKSTTGSHASKDNLQFLNVTENASVDYLVLQKHARVGHAKLGRQ